MNARRRRFNFNLKPLRTFTGYQTPAKAKTKAQNIAAMEQDPFAACRNNHYVILPEELPNDLWVCFERDT